MINHCNPFEQHPTSHSSHIEMQIAGKGGRCSQATKEQLNLPSCHWCLVCLLGPSRRSGESTGPLLPRAAAPDSPAAWLGAPGQSASRPDPCPCVVARAWLLGTARKAVNLHGTRTEERRSQAFSRFPQQPRGGAYHFGKGRIECTESPSGWVVRAGP